MIWTWAFLTLHQFLLQPKNQKWQGEMSGEYGGWGNRVT
jgi:hypothetical protein